MQFSCVQSGTQWQYITSEVMGKSKSSISTGNQTVQSISNDECLMSNSVKQFWYLYMTMPGGGANTLCSTIKMTSYPR